MKRIGTLENFNDFLNVKCNNGGGVYDYVGIQFLAIFGKKMEYSSNCNFKGLRWEVQKFGKCFRKFLKLSFRRGLSGCKTAYHFYSCSK